MGKNCSSSKKQYILVLEKSFRIQEYIAKYPYGISLADLTRLVGMNKSTVFRIVDTLNKLGYITQSPNDGKYRLSYKYFTLSNSVLNVDLKHIANPYLKALSARTGVVCHLSVPDNNRCVIIDKTDAMESGSIQVRSHIGDHSYFHCSAGGKTLLSAMPEDKVREIIAQTGLPAKTDNTITDMSMLERELEKIRKCGYAIDDLENEEYIRCVAAPIYNMHGKIIASVSLSETIFVMTREKIPEFADEVMKCAADISTDLGYQTAKEEQ